MKETSVKKMSRLQEKLLFTSYNPMTSYVLNIFICKCREKPELMGLS